MTQKELREKMNALAAQIDKYRTDTDSAQKDQSWTAEQDANWKTLNDDFSRMKSAYQRAQAAEAAQEFLADQGRQSADSEVGREPFDGQQRQIETKADDKPTAEDRLAAFQSWATRGSIHTEANERACRKLKANFSSDKLDGSPTFTDYMRKVQQVYRRCRKGQEQRDLSSLIASAGGVLVPETLVATLTQNMVDYSGMLQAATIMNSGSGGQLTMPTVDDASNTGRQIGENTAVTETDPTFGGVVWSDYTFSSDMVQVPFQLLEDSIIDAASLLGQLLGVRLGRIFESKFTTGTGAATPKGITVAAATGKTTASSTAIAFDEVLDLLHSVDPSYRNGAAFMAHDSIWLAIRKLKDGFGQYLWETNAQIGQPDTLRGFPTFINQNMSSTIATTDITMLFGQFTKYIVRMIGGQRFLRLNERYAENGQVAFLAYQRADGNLLTASTTNTPVKKLVQA